LNDGKKFVGYLFPNAGIDGWVGIDGWRLSVRVRTAQTKRLEIGDVVSVQGFDEQYRFEDCLAELVRLDYLGEGITKMSFYRLRD
jgi:hypothetical protein